MTHVNTRASRMCRSMRGENIIEFTLDSLSRVKAVRRTKHPCRTYKRRFYYRRFGSRDVMKACKTPQNVGRDDVYKYICRCRQYANVRKKKKKSGTCCDVCFSLILYVVLLGDSVFVWAARVVFNRFFVSSWFMRENASPKVRRRNVQ